VYLDHELIVPHQSLVHEWFSNKFKRIHDFRTLKYMTHVVESDLLDDDKKEKYLQFVDYTDAITGAATDHHKDKFWASIKLPNKRGYCHKLS
jgi:hypothetical protein